jgi:hypothetical protein
VRRSRRSMPMSKGIGSIPPALGGRLERPHNRPAHRHGERSVEYLEGAPGFIRRQPRVVQTSPLEEQGFRGCGGTVPNARFWSRRGTAAALQPLRQRRAIRRYRLRSPVRDGHRGFVQRLGKPRVVDERPILLGRTFPPQHGLGKRLATDLVGSVEHIVPSASAVRGPIPAQKADCLGAPAARPRHRRDLSFTTAFFQLNP